jgi:hypothetical protein
VTFLAVPHSTPYGRSGQARLTERRFMAQVVAYAELMRWRVYHTLRSDGSAAGFPDLVLVRARHPRPRVVFAELKAQRTPVTDDQRAWIAELRACGQEAWIWRPSDIEQITRILR